MRHFTRLPLPLFVAAVLLLPALHARGSAYDAHPKLVVLLIADQLPGGSLERYRSDFKGEGFLLLLDQGAFFDDCYFDYANTGAAPGYAALLTGAYTDGNGIAEDRWWDVARDKDRQIGAVEDSRYPIVGLPSGEKPGPGASPLNLRASTLGDALRIATQGESKVYSVGLREDAAVLTGGYAANAAFWVDAGSGSFLSSSYYMRALPDWAEAFNASGRIAQAEQDAGAAGNGNFLKSVAGTPAVLSYELDFTRALITGEKLGNGPATDLLIVNLPAEARNPGQGERQMIDALDQQISDFNGWLKKNIPGGPPSVWIAFTADRGASPSPKEARQLGFPAARIDVAKFIASLNASMNAKFSPGEKLRYLLPEQQLPYISLDAATFESVGVNEPEAERAILNAVPSAVHAIDVPATGNQEDAPSGSEAKTAKPPAPGSSANTSVPNKKASGAGNANGSASESSPESAAVPSEPVMRLPPVPSVVDAYTRLQLAAGTLAPSHWGRILAHSYSPNGGWYVMVIPGAYQAQSSGAIQSPWSYARHIPLALYGAPFVPGLYRERVQPVDVAATLASLLEINLPSASIGNILTRAIREVPRTPARRTAGRYTRSKRRVPTTHQGERK